MQKARRHPPFDKLRVRAPTACRQTVSGTISLLCQRCFSPFPHGTGSLSVSREYLALRDGPRRFRQDFTCPALLRIPLNFVKESDTGLSPSLALFPAGSPSLISCHSAVLQPPSCRNIMGLGYCAFARHYLRNHFCFLFLWVLRCFSSPRSLTLRCVQSSTKRVAPFGYPGIKGYLHLPQAFRSLSRPSSPPRAKASTVCPSLSFFFLHNKFNAECRMQNADLILNS